MVLDLCVFVPFDNLLEGGHGMGAIGQCVSPKPGEWVKGKLVGCGSFGTVHLAMSKSTGALFVVKSAYSSSSGAGREALNNEVKILKSLSPSPYIVQFFGAEEEGGGGNLNVLMEYMAGGSLADVAQKFGGSLNEEVVRVYTRDILRGLMHLHQHGIVHRDVKCKNMLLGSSGNIKLGDFGCAKRVKDLNMTGLANSWQCVGGTPLWMAPEVLRNESLDFGADIWSLGCTVIEMATGRPPWDASHEVSNPMAAVLRIAHGDRKPPFPIHFTEEGLDFLSRCLQRDPKRRCTAEELLRHPFISTRASKEEYEYDDDDDDACSPASVLEVQSFDDDLDKSKNNFSSRLPSAWAWYYGEPEGITAMWKREDNACALGSMSSENWITVRSS